MMLRRRTTAATTTTAATATLRRVLVRAVFVAATIASFFSPLAAEGFAVVVVQSSVARLLGTPSSALRAISSGGSSSSSGGSGSGSSSGSGSNLQISSTSTATFSSFFDAIRAAAAAVGGGEQRRGGRRPDELSYRYWLAKARECAFSPSSDPQEARAYLTRILELEGRCAAGTVSGRDLCDEGNAADVADVVARLRRKASAVAADGNEERNREVPGASGDSAPPLR